MTDSIYDQLNAHGTIAKQRFVENFSGDAPDVDRWGFGHQDASSGNLASMADEAGTATDGSGTGVATIPFRQFSSQGAVMISVWKRGSTGAGYIAGGLCEQGRADIAGNNLAVSWCGTLTNTDHFYLRTSNSGGSQTETSSTVSQDSNFHTHKIETKNGSVDFSLDGATAVTSTGNVPSLTRVAPLFSVNKASQNMQVRYCEVYNT